MVICGFLMLFCCHIEKCVHFRCSVRPVGLKWHSGNRIVDVVV